jgi:Histone methylation protein DOT1
MKCFWNYARFTCQFLFTLSRHVEARLRKDPPTPIFLRRCCCCCCYKDDDDDGDDDDAGMNVSNPQPSTHVVLEPSLSLTHRDPPLPSLFVLLFYSIIIIVKKCAMNGIIGTWQGSNAVDTCSTFTNIVIANDNVVVVSTTDTEEFSPFVVGCDPLSSFQCLVTQGYHARKDMTYLADMLPPPPPPMSGRDDDKDHRERVDAIMQTYWRPNDGFFGSSSSSNKEYDDDDDDDNHAALTYGEVTSLGCRQLAYAMNIHQSSSSSSNNDVVFVDLGSGVGRLVTQMYLDHYPFHRIQKAVGVELSQERHDIGIRALQSIIEQELVGMRRTNHHIEIMSTTTTDANPTELPQSSSSYTVSNMAIELIRGDAVEYLQSTTRSDGITHVYMSSLCFPDHVLEKLQRLLLQQQQSSSSSSSSSLQVVAALNRLDLFHQDSATWQETEVPIQMSWGPGVVKVYHRRRRPGQTRPDPTRPEQLE